MPIDPDLHEVLATYGEAGHFDVAHARDTLDQFAELMGDPEPDVDTRDREVGGVPVRRYLPTGEARTPPIVWLHGGGWVIGSLDAVDPMCRAVLTRSGAALTSVHYRLAPEHAFPAALDDCLAVVRTLAQDGPVVVAGDSAGGGLAAAAALQGRKEGLPIAAQLLVNPLVDATLSSPSIREFATGYGLTEAALEQFVALYLQDSDPHDPRCSPLLADDLSDLPPTVVVTAECDPLRDEGEAYADRLAAAGVPVAVRRFPGMVHGFVGMAAVTPVADEAMDWMIDELVRLVEG